MAISISELRCFVESVLVQCGCSKANSQTASEALVETDALGVFTHGTKLLSGYVKKLQGGGYVTNLEPKVEREGLAWAIVDGRSNLGQIGSVMAMELAIDKSKKCGIAYVGLRDSGHIGAAGYYATMAARRGMIGMVTGNDIPSVAAPGSKTAVLGSNPIAYSIPRQNAHPILLDIATAAVAGGKIYAARQRGETIPSTWLIDRDGKPTTDALSYPQSSCLAPMAGHKGYGFGLWCEVLSAVLPGGNMTWQVGSWMFDDPSMPSNHNASFIAIDVEAMMDMKVFSERLQHLIDEIHSAPTAEGIESVLLPGEREWRNYDLACERGIPLPEDVIASLATASQLTGTPLPESLTKSSKETN